MDVGVEMRGREAVKGGGEGEGEGPVKGDG